MSGAEPAGVAFPVSADGRRSTSALGRAVVAGALSRVDPAGARAAEREKNWRKGYLAHFRELVEAGLASRQAALAVASGGLESLHRRMRFIGRDGQEAGLDTLASAPARIGLATVTVTGTGTAERELSVPYHGEQLRGSALQRRLETWVTDGVIEPSCADAVRTVAAHPDWLAVPGQTIVVLGAGAEVGPLPVLLSWGARVMGVDLQRPVIWERVLAEARRGAGTLLVPAAAGDADLAQRAGLDLTEDIPAMADWLVGFGGPLVLGNYVYADGAANVLLSAAVDALILRVAAARGDVALAFLATPTDVFAVPADAVAQAARAYATRSPAAKLGGSSLRAASGGRLMRPAYPPGADPGICDSLIPQQGPNYALAKRVHRWRATVARDSGACVSMNVAPPTRTRSVLKNRALAAAYAGAPRFGVEVFEPATTKTLMAALLVHDLHAGGGPAQAHPWQDEAQAAAHGGLWRIAYAPRSALTLAALMGYRPGRPGSSVGRSALVGRGGGQPAAVDGFLQRGSVRRPGRGLHGNGDQVGVRVLAQPLQHCLRRVLERAGQAGQREAGDGHDTGQGLRPGRGAADVDQEEQGDQRGEAEGRGHQLGPEDLEGPGEHPVVPYEGRGGDQRGGVLVARGFRSRAQGRLSRLPRPSSWPVPGARWPRMRVRTAPRRGPACAWPPPPAGWPGRPPAPGGRPAGSPEPARGGRGPGGAHRPPWARACASSLAWSPRAMLKRVPSGAVSTRSSWASSATTDWISTRSSVWPRSIRSGKG